MTRIIPYYLYYFMLLFVYCFAWTSLCKSFVHFTLNLRYSSILEQYMLKRHDYGITVTSLCDLNLLTKLVSSYFSNQDTSSFQDKVTKFNIKIYKQFSMHCCKTRNGVKIKRVKVIIPIKILPWFLILLLTFSFYF